jgi:hypothetical protein
MTLGSIQPITEISTKDLPRGKERPVRKADNLTAICEAIVYKMWKPWRLTILWASKASYRDGFTFFVVWNWIFLEERRAVQPLKKFPTFYGTRRFIIVFTRTLHWLLSQARRIQYTSSPLIYLRSILIVSSRLLISIPSVLFPPGFPTKILHAFISCLQPSACSFLLILLDSIFQTIFGKQYILWGSMLCNFLDTYDTLMLLWEKISVYCENHIKHINTLLGQNQGFLFANISDTYCGV